MLDLFVRYDHHMLDVALYHYWTTGELPCALFHADRHSDWCKDSYLEARRPQQELQQHPSSDRFLADIRGEARMLLGPENAPPPANQ